MLTNTRNHYYASSVLQSLYWMSPELRTGLLRPVMDVSVAAVFNPVGVFNELFFLFKPGPTNWVVFFGCVASLLVMVNLKEQPRHKTTLQPPVSLNPKSLDPHLNPVLTLNLRPPPRTLKPGTYCCTTVLRYYYCTVLLVYYYCTTTVLLLYYYCTAVVLLYYYYTTALLL